MVRCLCRPRSNAPTRVGIKTPAWLAAPGKLLLERALRRANASRGLQKGRHPARPREHARRSGAGAREGGQEISRERAPNTVALSQRSEQGGGVKINNSLPDGAGLTCKTLRQCREETSVSQNQRGTSASEYADRWPSDQQPGSIKTRWVTSLICT